MRVKVIAYPAEPDSKSRWKNFWEAVSQLIASCFCQDCNLTLSAHCGNWKERGDKHPIKRHFYKPINFLFRDSDHCQNAWKERT